MTRTATVNPLPSAITGTMNVCAGLTTTLANAGGGTWSSGNTAVATVKPKEIEDAAVEAAAKESAAAATVEPN